MTPAKSGITVLASRILAVLALVTGTLAVLAPSSGALPGPPCRVTKLRTTQVYDGTGSNLQSAIDAAQRGTRLLVRGLCVGNFTIGKNLRLFGRSTAAYPTPTLDANHVGRVLFVSAGSVLLKNLTITNGSAFPNEDGDATGGGIYNAGTLTLISSSSVRGNSARSGGGISNNGGTLSLSDSSSVRGNTAIEGGGILNYDHATLSLSDSSSVRGNTTTPGRGGGISNYASKVTLNDSSSVNYNRAVNVVSDTGGGGIFTYGGSLTLNGSSSVTGNTATVSGGGIVNGGRFNACDTWTGAISPNAPDDPPTPTLITC